MEWAKNVYWMVCLLLDYDSKVTRNDLMLKLREKSVDSRPFFYPISQMPVYDKSDKINTVTYDISRRGLNLPSSVNLTENEIEYICTAIKTILKYT